MAANTRGLFRDQIRTLFHVGTATGLTDGQLLERFATRRDEGSGMAFAVLVERHGPMVLRACRGILRDDHEAMDAFQATFLVLARKGGSLWVRDSLGPWLHRVACHAAGRARETSARRRAAEKRAAEMAKPRIDSEDREELASVIHEEINRLPERYRSTVVLCDLEGRTCEEAARHLGCPVGTVGSRLARGRQRLRDRLSRRGLAPGCGLLVEAGKWQGVNEPITAEIVSSTARAAAQFVSNQAIARGVAASLALRVLRTMFITRWWKVASVLFVLGASTSGVVTLAGRGATVGEAQADDPPKTARADGVAVVEVKPGRLSFTVEERGVLEASQNADVYSQVEGQTTILSILPEGTLVKKDQLVCELDAAFLKNVLPNQEISIKAAEAAYQITKLAREVAEIAVIEYVEGIYPNDLQAVLNEISLTESAIAKAEERLKRTQNARQRLISVLGGAKTFADVLAELDIEDRLDAAELTLDREKRSLGIGQARRVVLEKYTRDKTLKQLRNEVEKARPLELARQSSWELEKSKKQKLLRQIASCKVLAPADGMVVHANDPSRTGAARQRPQIEEGATIRERQKIFSVPNLDSPPRVVAKVPEAIIRQVRPQLTARIKVDAFPNETFSGAVTEIAPLPDPTTSFNQQVKVYTTRVALAKTIPGFRPGMIATVEILIAERENVLSVPVQSVVTYESKDHLAVKSPNGGIDWREVTLGLSDGKVVEVKEGLKPGDAVVIEPGPLLSEEQKQKMADSPPKSRAVRKPAGRQ